MSRADADDMLRSPALQEVAIFSAWSFLNAICATQDLSLTGHVDLAVSVYARYGSTLFDVDDIEVELE